MALPVGYSRGWLRCLSKGEGKLNKFHARPRSQGQRKATFKYSTEFVPIPSAAHLAQTPNSS